MISVAHTIDTRVDLITKVFSDHNEIEMVRQLSGENAQTFVDMINGVKIGRAHV